MQLDLTDEEASALLTLLNRVITDDRYPLSSRISMGATANSAQARLNGAEVESHFLRSSDVGSTAEEAMVCTTLRWREQDSNHRFRGGGRHPRNIGSRSRRLFRVQGVKQVT
jgi:hypothetical protein